MKGLTTLRRVVPASVIVGAVVFGAAAPAFANGTAIAVDVKDATITVKDTTHDKCTYQVTSDLTLINMTSSTEQVQNVTDEIIWHAPGGVSGVQDTVDVTDNAGLTTSVVLPANGQQTFPGYTAEFTIPCSATNGDLNVSVTTPQGTGSGDAPFLINGTPLPLGAVGGVGAAALLGVGLLFMQRRSRKRA